MTSIDYTITGTLSDSDTTETLGDATPEQVWASIDAGEEGHILVDGRRCYVECPQLSVSWDDYTAFAEAEGVEPAGGEADELLCDRLGVMLGRRGLRDCRGMTDESGWHLELRDLADGQ